MAHKERGSKSHFEGSHKDSVPAADGMEISVAQILPPKVVKQRVERGRSFKVPANVVK